MQKLFIKKRAKHQKCIFIVNKPYTNKKTFIHMWSKVERNLFTLKIISKHKGF